MLLIIKFYQPPVKLAKIMPIFDDDSHVATPVTPPSNKQDDIELCKAPKKFKKIHNWADCSSDEDD